ncbi:MAG: O-antigen ligase family protein, partial [Actinomycetota bacterium]
LLQLVSLREIGFAGFGAFSVLFGVLITVNSIQSGWLGDSLTVLDRFEPGIRRALVTSQLAIIGLTFLVTVVLALPVAGVDRSTALLFGLASVAWVVEETLRRLLIARREFWQLVMNDAAFAVGAFGLIALVAVSGDPLTLQTLVLALLSGAAVAIAVGVIQLPGHELSRGLLGPSRLADVARFAVWRAAQVGLRPGSQAVIRVVVVAAASYEALGQLEAARVLLAPILTVVNGAGVYLLPTYSAQARRGERARPAVPLAMALIGAAAAAYGVIALVLRTPLTELLTDRDEAVTALAVIAWTAFSVGFGAGVPAGNALVARGRSRDAFTVRVADAGVGIVVASALAVFADVDAVPLGLALGTVVGAIGLLRRLRTLPPAELDSPPVASALPEIDERGPAPVPGVVDRSDDVVPAALPDQLVWDPVTTTASLPTPGAAPLSLLAPSPVGPAVAAASGMRADPTAGPDRRPTTVGAPMWRTAGRRVDADRYLWLMPLVLVFATEYKFRRRSIDDALGGSVDVMILAELALYAVVGTWAVWRLAPTRPRLTALTVTMWGYILTTAASALYSTFLLLALARGVQLLIIGAVLHAFATDGRLHHVAKLLHAWIALLTVSIVAGLAYVAPTTNAQRGRFTWLFVHSVSAGSMLALSVPILFGLWLSSRRRGNPTSLAWPSWTYAALLVIHGVFLLLTRTRGSIGGAAIAVAVMAWIMSGTRARPQLVLGSLVGGGAAALAFGPTIITFLTRGETVESIGTFNRRTEIWSLAWEAFVSRPLHGLGFTSAKGVFFDETGLGGAHNALINVMIDAGIAGLAWWLGLLVAVGVVIGRVGRWARRSTRPGATGSASADHAVLVGIYTASLVNSVTTEGLGAGVNVSAIWLFVMVAWLCVLRRDAAPADGAPTHAAPTLAAPTLATPTHATPTDAAAPHTAAADVMEAVPPSTPASTG